MIEKSFDENISLGKSPVPPSLTFSTFKNIRFSSKPNNTKPSTSESNDLREDATIEKPSIVNDHIGVFTENFNTNYAKEEQSPTEDIDHHEPEIVSLVSDLKHIDELPVELLIDYLPLKDLCTKRAKSGDN